MSSEPRWIGRAWRAGTALTGILVVLPFLTACEKLLEVDANPETISAGSIGGSASFKPRYVGAQSDFIAAFDEAVLYGALFTDELEWGESFLSRDEVDRRIVRTSNDAVATDLYTPLQVAAVSTRSVQKDLLENKFPDVVADGPGSKELARVSLYSGYARLYLAELFCTLAFDGQGPEYQSKDVYAMAIEDFTRAIGAARVESSIKNAALVGRARARLDAGDKAGARADAAQVPKGFEFLASYSGNSTREENDLYTMTWGNTRLTVGVPFRKMTIDNTGVADPRVSVRDQGKPTFNGNVPLFTPNKYATRASPIRLASWEEAQYLIAEIDGGATARDIINAVRQARGITQVFDPNKTASAQEIRDAVVSEKARTLFMEGQRMGDLRRYADQMKLDLFPTGANYGTQTCIPLPDLERGTNPGLRQ
ncbi:MAG TPA: RagB/SusD family nutrient uptake outer membrane protein [Longimicrobiales bacterium]|nr:RagB/SusD family nutrient uptake outer membrane protein [Longimicrobiales bacterium]